MLYICSMSTCMGHIFVIYDILAVGAVWVIAGMDDGRRSGRGVAALQSTLTLQTVDKYICHLQKYICHLQKYILQWKTIREVKHNYHMLLSCVLKTKSYYCLSFSLLDANFSMPQTFLRVGTSCKNHGLRQRHFYSLADLVLFLKSLFSRPLFARAYPSSDNGLQHLFTNSVHCLFHFGGKLSKMRSAKWAKSPKWAKPSLKRLFCSDNDHGHNFNRGHSFSVIPNV